MVAGSIARAASLGLVLLLACEQPRVRLAAPSETGDAGFALQRLAVKLTLDVRRGTVADRGALHALVDSPEFASSVALRILSPQLSQIASRPDTLETVATVLSEQDEPRAFYFRAPCTRDQIVEVEPWWAPGTRVPICASSYHPESTRDPASGKYCNGYFAQGADELSPLAAAACGCGPHLMNCVPSDEAYTQLARGISQEFIDTLARNVAADRPLGEVFTGTATVQNRYSRFAYARWRVMTGSPPAHLLVPDAAPALEERLEPYPGAHAGLLTSLFLAYEVDSQRARAMRRSTLLWCVNPGSGHVDASSLAMVGGANLREREGWQRVAGVPACATCHAHMDYGAQFFESITSAYIGTTNAHPPFPTGTASMYGTSLDDFRGTTERSPAGYARLALADVAFERCVASRVVDYLLPEGVTEADLADLEATFRRRGSLKDVVHRAIDLALSRPALATLADPLDVYCRDCHDGGERPLFEGGQARRDAVPAMIDAIAEGRMPPDLNLPRDTQRALVEALLPRAWDARGQVAGRAFYLAPRRYLQDRRAVGSALATNPACYPTSPSGPVDGKTVGMILDGPNALRMALAMSGSPGKARCEIAPDIWKLLFEDRASR
jgi:hypothetical protein